MFDDAYRARFSELPLGRDESTFAILETLFFAGEDYTGRTNFRSLAGAPEFASLAREGTRQFEQEWAARSAGEREALVLEGEAYGATLEEELRRGR